MLQINKVIIEDLKEEDENPLNEIWQELKRIEYGAYNLKTKKYVMEIDEDNYNDIKLLTPSETIKCGRGTCYEQAILTAYLAKKNKLDYSCGFFMNKRGNTHLVCCVKYKNQWYWVEHAWGMYQKVHGPYPSLKRIDQLISKLMTEFHKSPITYKKFDFNVEAFFHGSHMYPELTKGII